MNAVVVCVVLWVGVVLTAATVAPPRPQRFRVLLASGPVVGGGRRTGRWRPGVDGRRRAAAVVAALAALLVWPPLVLAVGCGVVVVPRWRRLRDERRAEQAVIESLPDVIDLVGLAATAGLTVPLLVTAMAERAPPPFGAAFATVRQQVERGQRLGDALAALPEQLGEPVRPLTAALVASVRYGVPLAPALEHLAYDARRERRRRADIVARKVPVRMCFPLVGCILPAFALLTIVPLLAGALSSLRL